MYNQTLAWLSIAMMLSLVSMGVAATPTGVPATPTGVPATPTAVPATPTAVPATPSGPPITPTGAPATPTGTPATPPGLTLVGSTDINPTVNIGVEKCLPTDHNKLLSREKDDSGLTIEIYCNGDYRMKVTRPDGSVVYAGKCKFPRAVNIIKKKIHLKGVPVYRTPDGKLVAGGADRVHNPNEIEWTYWKNIEAIDDPTSISGTEGPVKEGKDLLWTYVPKTNQIVLQKTKQKGKWVKSGDPDYPWTWALVGEQEKDGDPSAPRPAPGSPDGLETAGAPPEEGTHRCAATPPPPQEYEAHTPIPVTVVIDGRPHTMVLRLRAGARLFEAAELEARADHLFAFHIDLPGEAERLITFRLLKSPGGMTIGPSSGIIEWTPRSDQVGDHPVVVEYAYAGLSGFSDQFVLRVAGPEARQASVLIYALLLVVGVGLGILAALAYRRTTLRAPRTGVL